jgi:serine/threonine protein kinase
LFVPLLEHVQDIDMQDDRGKTLLHLATYYNSQLFVRELLRLGASLTITDNNGYVPCDFGTTDHMKMLFDTFEKIIACVLSRNSTFDWKRLGEYSRFVQKWRSPEDENTLLHFAMTSGNQEAISAILTECPDLLLVQNRKGVSYIDQTASSSHASLFALALHEVKHPITEQLFEKLKINVFLLKTDTGEFVYEGMHPLNVTRFLRYIFGLPDYIQELEAIISSNMVYSLDNQVGILAMISQVLEFISVCPPVHKCFQSNKRIVETEQAIQEVEDILLHDPGSENISVAIKKRNQSLKETVSLIQSEVKELEYIKTNLAERAESLYALEKKLIGIAKEFQLPNPSKKLVNVVVSYDMIKESIASFSFCSNLALLIKCKDILSDDDVKYNEKEIIMAKVLKIIPSLFADQDSVRVIISDFISSKVLELETEILRMDQDQTSYSLVRDRLESYLKKFEEMLDAIEKSDSVILEYESYVQGINELEEKIAILEVRSRKNQKDHSNANNIEVVKEELKNFKRNPDFVTIRRQLCQWSSLLPEIQSRFQEFGPLGDTEISKKYPAKDFDVDFKIEKQLSPRVFLVRGSSNGTKTVLKKFNSSEGKLLRHAIVILDKLKHQPAILKLLSVVNAPCDNLVYLELPYYAYGDLYQWRTGPYYQPDRMGKIFFDVIKGLQQLHSNGILHRDIKPQNILLSETRAVLSDFDLGEFKDVQTALKFEEEIGMTTEFICPEIMQTRKHTIESDVFSLGITIGNVLQGCPIPVTRTQAEFEESELTPEQMDLVLGLTKVDPNQRITLRQALRNPFLRGDIECSICNGAKLISEGILVDSRKDHFICHPCLERHFDAESSKPISYLIDSDGEIRIPLHSKGPCEYFSFEFLWNTTSPTVIAFYLKAKYKFAKEKNQIKEQTESDTVSIGNPEYFNNLEKSLLRNKEYAQKLISKYLQREKAFELDEFSRQCPSCDRAIQKGMCIVSVCGSDKYCGTQQTGCGDCFNFQCAPRFKSKVDNLDLLIQEFSLLT